MADMILIHGSHMAFTDHNLSYLNFVSNSQVVRQLFRYILGNLFPLFYRQLETNKFAEFNLEFLKPFVRVLAAIYQNYIHHLPEGYCYPQALSKMPKMV